MSLLTVSRDKMLGQAANPNPSLQLADVCLQGTANWNLRKFGVIKYFRRLAQQDPFALKTVVLLALAIDTLDTAASEGLVYLNTVTHWGDEAYSNTRSLIVPVFVILTGVSAAITRLYLTYRYWEITTHRVPSLVFMLIVIAALTGTGLFAGSMVMNPSYDDHDRLRIPAIFWMGASVGADVFIALALLLTSRQSIRAIHRHVACSVPPKRNSSQHLTAASFSRFCTVALQTGVLGAAFSTATLILIILDKQETNLSFAVSICLGRVYTHAMLRNLNSRGPEAPHGKRPSLPPTIQLAHYPFLPSPPDSDTTLRLNGWLGRKPNISSPILVEETTFDHFAGLE
ncbi:hypothetical protein FB451DRAFT_1372434, partial [Mycena latifolia]